MTLLIRTYKVIHEVLPNTGQVDEGGDAMLLELILGTDTRPVEDVGAAIRAATDNDLLVRAGLHDRAILEHGTHTRGTKLTARSIPLDDDLVDVGIGDDVYVAAGVLLGDKVGAGGAQTLGDGPGRVAAPVRVVAVGEHVRVQGQALGLHGVENQVRDGGEVVRLGAQVAIVAVGVLGGVEPWLGLEGLGLDATGQSVKNRSYYILSEKLRWRGEETDLLHVLEELLAAPAGHVPVIVVLLGSPDGEGAIAAGGAAQELAPAELHLAVVDAGTLLRDDVPVGLLVKVLGPATERHEVLASTCVCVSHSWVQSAECHTRQGENIYRGWLGYGSHCMP